MSNPHATATATPFQPSNFLTQLQGGPRSRAHSPNPYMTTLLPNRGGGQVVAQGSMDSQTQTQTSTPVHSGGEEGTTVVLRLRGAHERRARPRVQWAEDVVDNEDLGRKSSKGTLSTVMTSLELHSRALGLL